MITTIDRAGRIVIPKAIREQMGLDNTVEISTEGDKVIIEPPTLTPVRNREGRLRLPATGGHVSVDDVREARFDAQH